MQILPLSPSAQPKPVLDLAALKRGNLSPADQRTAVSSQFEAILLRQFLQNSVGSMMGGGTDKSGGGGSVYSYMLTDTLADKLSQGRGMGIAPMIAKQLTPRGAVESAAQPEAKEP